MDKDNKSKQFEMRVSDEDLQNIAKLAKRMKRKKSAAVRAAIEAMLKMTDEELILRGNTRCADVMRKRSV